jgi:hypothetical protein
MKALLATLLLTTSPLFASPFHKIIQTTYLSDRGQILINLDNGSLWIAELPKDTSAYYSTYLHWFEVQTP